MRFNESEYESSQNYNSYRSSSNDFLEDVIQQIEYKIDNFLQNLQQTFHHFCINFLLEPKYLKKVLIAMIAPTELRISYPLQSYHYINPHPTPLPCTPPPRKAPSVQGQIPQVQFPGVQGVLLQVQPPSFQSPQIPCLQRPPQIPSLQRPSVQGPSVQAPSLQGPSPQVPSLQIPPAPTPSVQTPPPQASIISFAHLVSNPDSQNKEQHLSKQFCSWGAENSRDVANSMRLGVDDQRIVQIASELSETMKYSLLTMYIRSVCQGDGCLTLNELILKVGILNGGVERTVARDWLEVYFKRMPQIADMMVEKGNPINLGGFRGKGRGRGRGRGRTVWREGDRIDGGSSEDEDGPRKVKSRIYSESNFQ